jgi:hypothetical protein
MLDEPIRLIVRKSLKYGDEEELDSGFLKLLIVDHQRNEQLIGKLKRNNKCREFRDHPSCVKWSGFPPDRGIEVRTGGGFLAEAE